MNRPGTARQLVIFAKAPRLGAVKRRLAAEIGDEAALAFYRECLAGLLARLAGDPRWRITLAVTPDGTADAPAEWPLPAGAEAVLAPQGAGDLGERMARCFKELPAGPLVLVGSDIPTVGTDHIARAFKALETHDFVFGPARDGGYWLVGASEAARPRLSFAGTRWSSAHALSDTRAALPEDATVALVDELEDIDDAAALERWRQQAR